jgi:hypothetical protein
MGSLFSLCFGKPSVTKDRPPSKPQNPSSIPLSNTSSPKPPNPPPTHPSPPLIDEPSRSHSNRPAASSPLPVSPHSYVSPPVDQTARPEFSQGSPAYSNRRGRSSNGSTSYNPSSQDTHVGYPHPVRLYLLIFRLLLQIPHNSNGSATNVIETYYHRMYDWYTKHIYYFNPQLSIHKPSDRETNPSVRIFQR